MNRGNFSIDPDEEMKRNCCGLRGRGFDDFSREDLRDIILHKNKVIADLEEHAYGSASWIENLNKGLKVAKQIKDKVDKKPPKESEEDFRKRLEGFDKERDAPTEEWGADELNGEGLFDDITAALPAYQKEKKDAYDKLPEAEKLKLETERKKSIAAKRAEVIKEAEQKAIKYLDEDKDKPYYEKSLKLKLGNLTREQYIQNFKDKRAKSFDEAKGGAAAPKAEPKAPSGVAVAAEALKPVREAIQKGIGDAIYGKSDDPRKQKKGLLGISEEGKEESQKKVMKNIVVPIVKTASALKTNTEDIANMIFNPDKYDDDMKERRIKRIKAEEAKAGIVRDKTNPMIIIRKPRGFWTAETSDPKEEAYNQKRAAWRGADNVFYIRVPNPIFAAKLRPSFKEFSDAGVKLWTGVQQNDPKRSEDVDGTLQSLHDDEFIWIPESRAKEIYGQLRQFVANKQDEGVMEGYEDEGWTKGQLKEFAKIDPRTLKGQELVDWKQSKLALDKATTRNALEKVNKDIAEEEKKATPDKARLAKMREAKVRVDKRLKDLDLRGQKEFNEGVAEMNAERDKLQGDYYAKQRADAQANRDQDAADKAEFDAKPIAERIRILEAQGFEEQVEQLRAEEASEKVEEQAQGSVDLLQQAQVVGGGISSSKTNKVAPEPPSGPVSAVQYPIRNAVVGQVVGCSEADTAVILAALKLANKVGKDAILSGGMGLSIGSLKIEYTDNFKAAVRGTILYEFFYYQQRGQDLVIYMSDVAVGRIVGRPPMDDIIREAANEVCLWTLNEIRRMRADKVAVFDAIKQNTARVRRMTGNGMTGSAKPCWKGYEMIGMKQKGKRTVPNCVPIGGEGGEVDDDDESVEDIDIIRIDMGKGQVYLVDAPPKDKKGKLVGLPFASFKAALSGPLGIGNRRVFDAETEEEVGLLRDPIYKKLAMKVYKMEEEWRAENLKKLGVAMDEDDDEMEGSGAKPVKMKQSDYYKEHQNIVKLLKNTGKSLLSEAKDQQKEATAMAKKMDAPDPFDGMVGSGAVEYTLQKAGKSLFNPSGDMSKAGQQLFTPDYDAYGETVEEGRKNAFNLARSMYDQTKAIELPDFTLIKDDTSLRFYKKHDENVILVGIRGTDVKSWKDLYTWAVIGANQDLRMTTRFQDDLAKLVSFQRNYPPQQFYYVATGSSLAGSIADRFLEMGLIEEAITYNPSIERKYVLEEGVLNHRVYLDTDPLFMLMGQYAPNTEIRVNPNKTNFYNPSKEKDYLIASHSIYPIYNPAFEGGGMEGSGKTYTIEEWKAIFDAKLEQKRKAIEAREAKKKQTAKAKRERAKARRDARDEPPPLETPFRTSRTMKATQPKEPEEEEPEVEIEEYEMGGETYLVEAPRKGLAFAERRVFDSNSEEIGNLTEDDVGKTLVKMVMRREKLGVFADKSPKAKSSSESLPSFESKKPKEPEPEEEEGVAVGEYTYRKKIYFIEDPMGEEDMNLEFYANRRVFDADDEELGKLGDDNPLMKGLMKLVIKQEFPSQKDYRETMGLDAKKPRASKAKAPASARVELREELVAEQPRNPAGEFAKDAEPLQLVVSEVKKQLPQRDYMKLMKSPAFTGAERRLLGLYLSTPPITSRMRAKLAARSGLARKLMELLGIDESAFQTRSDRLKIADTVEKRVEGRKVREIVLPEDIEALFKRQEEGLISYVAEYMTRKTKDLGRLVSSFLDYPETFARCGFGCLGLVAKCMSADPLDTYYVESGRKLLKPLNEQRKITSRLALIAEVTQAEESHLTLTRYWSEATREDTTMNFGRESTPRFILPELTNTCLGRLTGIDGIREVFNTTRSAGMGYRRRNEWQVIFTDRDGLKRWSASENKELLAKIKTKMMPKVEKMAEDLKEPMLGRAKLMKERLEASLTDFQKKAVAEYKK